MQHWRLDCSRQTLVLAATGARLPQVVYWGAPLPLGEDLTTIHGAHAIDVTGGMLDENPDLSICPEASRTFPGQPGMIIRSENGTPLLPKFCYESDEVSDDALALIYRDETHGLSYTATFQIEPISHIITAQATLNADAPIHLHWLSAPVFPASQQSAEMIDFAGRWCGEFQPNLTAWSAGIRMRE
ncbi:MAG: glycoside hydrolase family 36 N-terminal domain-containing protein, partial [Planktotalea sp.]|uniref:glycoside hydrolase family 36 N-terminal domain-containing protein n=1 Tax=Planktotalea sp. TaxID=2029877 RepID=UPI003C73243E